MSRSAEFQPFSRSRQREVFFPLPEMIQAASRWGHQLKAGTAICSSTGVWPRRRRPLTADEKIREDILDLFLSRATTISSLRPNCFRGGTRNEPLANLSAALWQVRRTRYRLDAPPTENFDQYRPDYVLILEEVADHAGDLAFDELKQWMIETTEERKKLPAPTGVRKQAREICKSCRVTVPRQSPIRG